MQYKLKRKYMDLQISDTKDTSIKRPISGQSTPMVKGCTDIYVYKCLIQ